MNCFSENFSFLMQLALAKQVLPGLYTMFNAIIYKSILQNDWARPRRCALYLHCTAVLTQNSSCAIAYIKEKSFLYKQHSRSHVNLARTRTTHAFIFTAHMFPRSFFSLLTQNQVQEQIRIHQSHLIQHIQLKNF